jgi:hypothetical protein
MRGAAPGERAAPGGSAALLASVPLLVGAGSERTPRGPCPRSSRGAAWCTDDEAFISQVLLVGARRSWRGCRSWWEPDEGAAPGGSGIGTNASWSASQIVTGCSLAHRRRGVHLPSARGGSAGPGPHLAGHPRLTSRLRRGAPGCARVRASGHPARPPRNHEAGPRRAGVVAEARFRTNRGTNRGRIAPGASGSARPARRCR